MRHPFTKAHAEALVAEQAKVNDGRGSVCARTIATYIMRGEIDDARQVWEIDRDKIRQYPALMRFMNEMFGTDYV